MIDQKTLVPFHYKFFNFLAMETAILKRLVNNRSIISELNKCVNDVKAPKGAR